MKTRNLLVAFVLALMVLCASVTSATPAPDCVGQCNSTYDACRSSCGGDPECLTLCRDEFICCKLTCWGAQCTN